MARPKTTYIADPTTADKYFTLEEASALFATKGVAIRGETQLTHLLSRLVATIVTYRAQIEQLHREVDRMRIENAYSGESSTLDPASSLRFLAPQELSRYVEGRLAELADETAQAYTDANRIRQQAQSEANNVKLVVRTLQEKGLLDDNLRRQLSGYVSEPATENEPQPHDEAPSAGGGFGGLLEEQDDEEQVLETGLGGLAEEEQDEEVLVEDGSGGGLGGLAAQAAPEVEKRGGLAGRLRTTHRSGVKDL